MIQRIQSIYLIIVSLLNGLAAFLFADNLDNILDFILNFDYEYHIYFGIVGLLAFLSLLMFKNRTTQLKIGIFNIVLNFVALGLLIYWLLTLPGEMSISEKGIGLVLPFISIVFIVLAQKAIKRDDELVKSADRFR